MTACPRIAILSRQAGLYSTRRLVEAVRSEGGEPVVLQPEQCVLALEDGAFSLWYEDRLLEPVAGVIPRIGSPITALGMRLLEHFSAMGSYCLNSASSFFLARDKWTSLQILARAGIPVPRSWYLSQTGQRETVLAHAGVPVVAKLLQGSQGVGVTLAESQAAARGLVDTLLHLEGEAVVQEVLPGRRDYRLLVLQGRVIAAMGRTAAEGEFRSNLHCGGTAFALSPAELDTWLAGLATASATALGLDFAGVDLMPDAEGGFRVLEVNPVPSLEGIEKTSGTDIARQIAEFMMRQIDGGAGSPGPSGSRRESPG